MHKAIVVGMLVLMASTVLAGCGGTETETETSKTAETSNKAELRVIDVSTSHLTEVGGVWYVDVMAEFENVGQSYGQGTVLVKVDGETSRSWPISLKANEEETVSFLALKLNSKNSRLVVEVGGSRQVASLQSLKALL